MQSVGTFVRYAAAAALAMGSASHAATISTASVSSATTFTVASSPLGGIVGCGIIPGAHSYGTTTFTTSVAATYSFRVTAITGGGALEDPFLAVYQGSFDPLNPTANLVGCNDDANNSLLSEFSASLGATTTYVMVATTYSATAANGTVTFSTGIVPSLALANLTASVGATGQSMVASSNSSGAITYSISDPSVATIDPTTGALTLLSAGTATVTATQAAEADPGPYNAGSATATLTVAATPPPVATPAPIPTLSEWGTAILAALTALAAAAAIRRRS